MGEERHHHLTVLAVAYSITKDEKYSQEIADQILDWIEHNPYLVGVNWTHPLEQAIRLIAWVWCYRLLQGSPQVEILFGESSPIWESIYHHQYFIEKTYSKGTSANNHLIGEMAGLFIAAVAFPMFDRSQYWCKMSRKVLEDEIVKQTFASGINRELAFSYHIFSLEFFILALIEAKIDGIQFSHTYERYTQNMVEVIPKLTDYGRNMPRYGDGDEGLALQLQARNGHRDSWLLHLGHVLCQVDVPSYDDGYLAVRALGYSPVKNDHWQPPSQPIAYEDAGLYLLTQHRSQPDEIFVLADAGPHGYLSIAAHAHADALSFVLSYGGKPIMVDVGTYAYHTDEHWRRYFKSTYAHNTVTIDRIDQSTQAGSFLWTQQANTMVEKWDMTENACLLQAKHDGYSDLGIEHTRTLTLKNDVLTVEDHLSGSDQHHISINFHLHPNCVVEQVESHIFVISHDDKIVRINFSATLAVALYQATDHAGWYSPEFGIKLPTYSIIAEVNQKLPASFTTIIEMAIENGES